MLGKSPNLSWAGWAIFSWAYGRDVTRMERESQLGTLDRGPYPLEIQPAPLVDDPIL